MFERRLKFFLIFLIAFTGILLLRAMQVQVFQKQRWQDEAVRKVLRQITTPTTRGRILDFKGRELAADQPCVDACVDYRVITTDPDAQWLAQRVTQRIVSTRRDEFRAADAAGKKAIRAEEEKSLRDQIARMWETLARESGQSIQQINAARQQIEAKVRIRQRSQWYRKYESAVRDHGEKEKPSWYRAWLLGEDSEAPELDEYDEKIGEETAAHVILPAIDQRLQNYLAIHVEEFPGLVLMPGTHRVYPFGEIGCHVIGHLSSVTKEDLAGDSEIDNELKRYNFTDTKGRAGVEALAEPMLRGSRGLQVEGAADSGTDDRSTPAVPGSDVRIAIDIELQTDIQDLLRHAQIPWGDASGGNGGFDTVDMHGAAVVIDVRSGQVRALVSNPVYDLNRFDAEYRNMILDDSNSPLMNRATQAQLEPGSTVKPIVGIGAITQNLVGVNEGIECTGYLIIGKQRYSRGRCWTASKFARSNPTVVAHHQIPWSDPHRGHDGNPDGFLTFADGLQRSCNVYFENLADRLQIDGLSYWMDKFGLGRPTGIGIAEACGRLPNDYTGARRDFTTWTAGIGQGCVGVTPIQMANVAATIAREGIWMRPQLLASPGSKTSPYKPTRPQAGEWDNIPDKVDLKLSREAIAAAKLGMIRVVNTDAGTGQFARRTDMIVAGKTGTAEAARYRRRRIDPATGKQMRDDAGKLIFDEVATSTHGRENSDARWYRGFDEDGKTVKHSWFIGFAPADNPQIAVAVMVEYGGSGGTVAGAVAGKVLDSLEQHGYLKPPPKSLADAH